MTTNDSPNEDIVKTIKQSIAQSGLLFQQHPEVDGWKSTRAAGPEVAAFTNKSVEKNTRLSLIYHEAGETDEDGYEWENDSWVVEYRGETTSRPHPSFTDRNNAITRLAEIMIEAN